MRYDLTIIGYDPKSKMILARHLAQSPSISLQKAMSMLDQLPVILYHSIDSDQVKEHAMQFSKIGVKFKAVPVQNDTQERKTESMPPTESFPHQPSVYKSKGLYPESHPGIMIGALSESNEKAIKDRKKLQRLIIGGSLFLLYILLMVWIFGAQKKSPKDILANGTLSVGSDSSAISTTWSASSKERFDKQSARKEITKEKKQMASDMIDSAKSESDNGEKAIYFYKMAIGFNKYNVNAWYGLLNVYQDAGKLKEATKTREEMDKLFGESIFSVARIIAPYGNLQDAQRAENGVYRLEYKTAKKSERELTAETFLIIKELRATCGCAGISLFASNSPGKGMLVSITTNTPFITEQEYKSTAKLRYLK